MGEITRSVNKKTKLLYSLQEEFLERVKMGGLQFSPTKFTKDTQNLIFKLEFD